MVSEIILSAANQVDKVKNVVLKLFEKGGTNIYAVSLRTLGLLFGQSWFEHVLCEIKRFTF